MKEKDKKESKPKAVKSVEQEERPVIASKTDLKAFLSSVRERLFDHSAAPIYALSALQYVFSLPDIYQLMDKANKDIAKEIWVRLKQAGMQLRNPPILFGADESVVETN